MLANPGLVSVLALFLLGGAFIALAGLNPRWREPVREFWRLYGTEFAIIGAIILPAAFGPLVFAALLLVLVWRGQFEMFALFDAPGFGLAQILALLAGGAMVAAAALMRADWLWLALAAGAAATAVVCAVTARFRLLLAAVSGFIYPALFAAALLWLFDGPHGFIWLVLTYATVEISDVAAYFGGKLIGRFHFLPRLSPRKTLEGFLIGLLAGAATGLAVAQYELGVSPLKSWPLVLAALLAGQVGDLSTSALKRWRGKKDFPPVLPPHGGVLDIYDSLLFAAPCVLLLRAVLAG